MKSSIQKIQTVFSILAILSKIAFVFSIIGAVGSAVGIISLLVGSDLTSKLENINLYSLIQNEAGLSSEQIYWAMGIAVVSCVVVAVTMAVANKCFKNELKAGTPFTYECSKDFLKLGIVTVVLSIIPPVLCAIAEAVADLGAAELEASADNESAVIVGVLTIFASLIFKYGADITENGKTAVRAFKTQPEFKEEIQSAESGEAKPE